MGIIKMDAFVEVLTERSFLVVFSGLSNKRHFKTQKIHESFNFIYCKIRYNIL